MLKQIIELTNDKIFSVNFTKKDGSIRNMTCRLGVKSYLKGGTKKFNDSDYNLLTVFDMEKKAYRSIPLDRINWLKIKGQKLQVR